MPRHVWKVLDRFVCTGQFPEGCGSTVIHYRHFMSESLLDFMSDLPMNGDIISTDVIYPGSLKKSPDARYVILWGLVEKTKEKHFRLTDEGIEFMKGKGFIATYIEAKHNQLTGWSPNRMDLEEAKARAAEKDFDHG